MMELRRTKVQQWETGVQLTQDAINAPSSRRAQPYEQPQKSLSLRNKSSSSLRNLLNFSWSLVASHTSLPPSLSICTAACAPCLPLDPSSFAPTAVTCSTAAQAMKTPSCCVKFAERNAKVRALLLPNPQDFRFSMFSDSSSLLPSQSHVI